MGTVGTGDASDSKSAKTDEGLLPAPPTDLWASVNRSENDIRIYWEVPDVPGRSPESTRYLIQGRPMTRHRWFGTRSGKHRHRRDVGQRIRQRDHSSRRDHLRPAAHRSRGGAEAGGPSGVEQSYANTKTDGNDMTMSDLEGHVAVFRDLTLDEPDSGSSGCLP